jgi:hypothetical protein
VGALALHPDTTLVTVISGASPFDSGLMRRSARGIQGLEPRVTFKYLTGSSESRMMHREVQTLPASAFCS